jgi:hypothetical protein
MITLSNFGCFNGIIDKKKKKKVSKCNWLLDNTLGFKSKAELRWIGTLNKTINEVF